jgi:hypothetical protein
MLGGFQVRAVGSHAKTPRRQDGKKSRTPKHLASLNRCELPNAKMGAEDSAPIACAGQPSRYKRAFCFSLLPLRLGALA